MTGLLRTAMQDAHTDSLLVRAQRAHPEQACRCGGGRRCRGGERWHRRLGEGDGTACRRRQAAGCRRRDCGIIHGVLSFSACSTGSVLS